MAGPSHLPITAPTGERGLLRPCISDDLQPLQPFLFGVSPDASAERCDIKQEGGGGGGGGWDEA